MPARIRSWLAALTAPQELPLAPGERRRVASDESRARAGQAAEDAAVAHLRRHGYRILCRNRANSIGELDIVARQGERLVFVEVRARREGSPVGAKDTLTAHKRRTLARTIELFVRQHRLANAPIRVDLIAITQAATAATLDLQHYQAIALDDH